MKDMYTKIQYDDWYENRCELKFSCPEIYLTVQKDEPAEGSFIIYSESGRLTEGYVSCREERMECLTPGFSGSEESIAFRFDTYGMREGEERTGYFLILSNQGEYEFPYRIRIARKTLLGSEGTIENLFQFTSLARKNWAEALRLFYSQDFVRLFAGTDRKYRNLYKGLSHYQGNEQNMEEFLVSAQQKQAVEYLVSSGDLTVNVNPVRMQEKQLCETIRISRNGWGYTRLAVEVQGDFLAVEKQMLREDDFLGNQSVLPVFIHPELLREGRNFGRIIFRHSYGETAVNITVIRSRENRSMKSSRRLELKKQMAEMVTLYQKFKMKKIGLTTWRSEMNEVLEKMRKLDDRSVEIRLYQVQLLMTESRFEEAGKILETLHVTLKENGPEVYCYYLYLSSLYHQDEAYDTRVQLQIEEMHRHFPDSWRIAWLISYLSPALRRSASQKWIFLEEQFRRSAASPVLYLEALQLVNASPTLIGKLDNYALQLLSYGVRQDYLSDDLIGHVVYLANKEKYYHDALYGILKYCYEKHPDKETLNAVCSLLIKGNKVGAEYVQWYRLGVMNELRVTRLYEHYMMSVDPEIEEEIPRIVLMYFAYQSNLEAEQYAYLYAYVLRKKEEFPELYLAYRGQIERFVLQQLEKGRTGKQLAFLYSQMPENGMLTPESADMLAPVLFLQQLECEDRDICKAVVIHTRLRGEQSYPVENGKAFIAVYDRDYEILLEDAEQNRYAVGKKYTITQLVNPVACADKISPWVNKNMGFDLYCCESRKGVVTVTEENETRFRYLSEDEQILPAFARAIRMALLLYYSDNEEYDELDDMLDQIRRDELEISDIPAAVEMLIRRSFYEKAYQWMEGVPAEAVQESLLLRLCSRLLESGLYAEDERMQILASSAFRRGKYDSRVLEYLSDIMVGSCRELDDVRKAAENFEIDTYRITQRLIVQLLYIREDVTTRTELLRKYVNEGGKSELEAAFLHRCSGLFLMEGKKMPEYILNDIVRMASRGEEVSDMCQLAYLEYYSRNRGERNAAVDETIRRFGEQLIRRDIRLPLFREYADILEGAEALLDKTMIVFKGDRDVPVTIHYRIRRMDQWEDGTKAYPVESLEMQHMYAGIYTVSFVLFAGESLQYYITRSSDGYLGERLDSGELKLGEISENMRDSRYGRINEISANWLSGEKDAAQELLEQYLLTEWMVDGLFGEQLMYEEKGR